MATKRQGATRSGGRRKGARRRRAGAQGAASRGARSGARAAQRREPAREVEAPQTGPRLVHPSPEERDLATEGAGEAQERAGAGETASREGETEDIRGLLKGPDDGIEEGQAPWQRGTPHAESRREQEAGAGGYPGFSDIALEIALGALRLTRTLLTAPLRLALALLRPREA